MTAMMSFLGFLLPLVARDKGRIAAERISWGVGVALAGASADSYEKCSYNEKNSLMPKKIKSSL